MSFIPESADGVAVPYTEVLDAAANTDLLLGALVLKDGSGDFAECGADPASIYGPTTHDSGPDTGGFNILGVKGFPPGKVMAVRAKGQVFTAEYVGNLPANPNGQFGVVKDADNKWKVDFNDAVNTRLVYLGAVEVNPQQASPLRVRVRFLDDNLQD